MSVVGGHAKFHIQEFHIWPLSASIFLEYATEQQDIHFLDASSRHNRFFKSGFEKC